jgi:DNA-binding transcriptional MerR regulator
MLYLFKGGLQMKFTIKQAAKMTGLSADTLRYYEKGGVISPKRGENGYRYYDENDIAALKHIIVMKYAHFSLAEIKSMEELQTCEPNSQCNEIAKRILNAKVTELTQAIHNYQKIITLMEALLSMAESIDAYHNNENRINEFIEQIFNDIQ